jgi:uncharacterized protein YkwD
MTTHLRALARRLGVVVVLPLFLGSALVVSPLSASSAEAALPDHVRLAAYEARVIHLMNVNRAKYQQAGLAASDCPDRYAEAWAARLGATGEFFHQTLPPMLPVCKATLVAENLARGNVSEDRIVAMWMASPGHRANILNARLNKIGVAAVYARGTWTVVADFTRA